MRKTFSLSIITSCLLIATSAFAGGNVYKVELNKTEIVRLPGAASSIIVGNPNIADVTVQSVNTIFVVGRGFGETNLIVLDSDGNTMMDTNIQVVNTLSEHGVRLYNAKNRETYSCIPYCGPSPVLGDSPDFINGNTTVEPELDNTGIASSVLGSSQGAPAGDASGSPELVGNTDFSSATNF